MHGFKSFARKIDIPFNDAFNCILGPNGSGKSNLGDGLCFVLGRISAKSMRAEKAANLIFNGGKKKKPASSAYVEIVFDNKDKNFPTEENEVVINRAITKKGSSIYRVNGKKYTRGQVVDLLALAKINPEGYNIILQGTVTKFVDMPPNERRKIIEEVSDVSLYDEKKHKALLELNKVEDKLNNAAIILKERKTYLRELKKDRDQALRFKDLKDKIDANKATYLNLQIEEKTKIKEIHDKEITVHEEKREKSTVTIEELKKEVINHKDEVTAVNKEIEQKGEKEQVKVHRQIEDLKVSLAKDKTRVSTLKDEISKIQQRKDQFAIELKDLEKKSSSSLETQKELQQRLVQKKKELEEAEKNIASFKKKHKIESSHELEQEMGDIDTNVDKKQEHVQALRQQQQELLREKDKIEYQLQTLGERLIKVKEVQKEHKEQIQLLQEKKQAFKAASLQLNQCLDNDSSFASQLANARRSLNELQEKSTHMQAKVASLQAGLAANKAVKSILDNKKRFRGVHGTIAELGQVKKKYAQALETAAGGKMQHIVVDTDETAATCISYLQKAKLGSASFIPLNKIRAQQINNEHKRFLKHNGVHDFAVNLVSYKSPYKKAFAYVFGNGIVVDDISTARKVGIGQIKMTTLDGNVAEASGVMRGGFKQRKTLSFREQDSLEAADKIEIEISSVQGVLHNLQNKREANEQQIHGLRTKKGELEGEIIKLEKSLHLDTDDLDASSAQKRSLQEQLKKVETNLREAQKEITLANRELADLKSKKAMLRSQISQLRNPRLLAQLQAFESSRQQTREKIVRLEGDLKGSAMQQNQMFAPEKEKILEIIKQHEKEEQTFIKEIKELSNKVTRDEKSLQKQEKQSKAFYSAYRGLFNRREKLSTQINAAENSIENAREKVRSAERQINLISLKNAEVKAKLAGLEEEFHKYKDVKLFDDVPVEQLKKEIQKFEVMLGQMAAVNMKALEVYEQVDKEFRALVDKREGLLTEKTDVLTLMNEIETKKKEHFMKTFTQANENFVRIFSSLFTKGKAYLELENKENPFEGGLQIKVKLTGSRFMDIKSLSGGEKTLTALSFIFAIQEYQPASFYILDEIDAALDKHNSERLAKLIRSYAERAQYVVVSHNDALISEADTLFGVSMQEGVSKIISLKI